MNFLNKNIDLSKISLSLNKKYINASPFPHVVIDDFFDSNFLNEILLEFPNLLNHKVANFNNPLEKKLGGLGSSLFGEKTSIFINFLNSEYFLNFLQKLTGIKEILLNDPYFLGGGLHEIKNGGFLKIHADFNKHTISIGFFDNKAGISLISYKYNINKDSKNEYFIGIGTALLAYTASIGWEHTYKKSKLWTSE